MVFLAAWFITIVSAITGVLEKSASLVMSVVMAWIASTLTLENSFDTLAYYNFFGAPPESHVFESGYLKLSYSAFTRGVTYFQFRTIVECVCFTLFFIGIVRFTNHPARFYAMYSIFPFLEDATQVRNFMMFSFAILAFSLFLNKRVTNYVAGLILLCIGASFQTTGYLYIVAFLLLLVVPYHLLQRSVKPVLIIMGSLASLIIIFRNFGPISAMITKLGFLSSRSDISDKLAVYASQGFSRSSILLVAGYLLSAICFVYLSDKINDPQKVKIFVCLILIGSLSIPFVLVSSGFERVIRNSVVVFFIAASCVKWKQDESLTGPVVSKFVSVVILCLMLVGAGYTNQSPGQIGTYVAKMIHL